MKAVYHQQPRLFQRALWAAEHGTSTGFKPGSDYDHKTELDINIVVRCGDAEYTLSPADLLELAESIESDVKSRANASALGMAHDLMKLDSIREFQDRLETLASKIADVMPELEHAIDTGFKDIHPDVYWRSSASQDC